MRRCGGQDQKKYARYARIRIIMARVLVTRAVVVGRVQRKEHDTIAVEDGQQDELRPRDGRTGLARHIDAARDALETRFYR